jgi:ribosomal protein L14
MDNCGAKYVECIKTFGGFNRKISYPGDFILVSIKQLRLIRKVRVGQIHLAVITRARKENRYLDGTSSKSENNVVLVLNKKKRIIGTRVFG